MGAPCWCRRPVPAPMMRRTLHGGWFLRIHGVFSSKGIIFCLRLCELNKLRNSCFNAVGKCFLFEIGLPIEEILVLDFSNWIDFVLPPCINEIRESWCSWLISLCFGSFLLVNVYEYFVWSSAMSLSLDVLITCWLQIQVLWLNLIQIICFCSTISKEWGGAPFGYV